MPCVTMCERFQNTEHFEYAPPIKIAERLSSDTYHCLTSRCSCTIRQMTFGRLRRGGCPRRERTTSWPCGGTASTFAVDGESKVNQPLRRKFQICNAEGCNVAIVNLQVRRREHGREGAGGHRGRVRPGLGRVDCGNAHSHPKVCLMSTLS